MRVCRTCLSKYDLCPLFGEQEFTSDQLYIATGVKIAPYDGKPQTACKPCLKAIKKSLYLREISSKVESYLNHISEHMVKSEQNFENNENDGIDPFLNDNPLDISLSEQTNDNYVLNDVDEFDNNLPSDDDTKPFTEDDGNQPIQDPEFVNIETKQEDVEFHSNINTRSRISAQKLMYPTEDGGSNSNNMPNIINSIIEKASQVPNIALSSLGIQLKKAPITKDTSVKQPTNVKYVVKCNAVSIENCRSEICQTILENKLQSVKVSDQTATVSGQTFTVSGHIPVAPGQSPVVSCHMLSISDKTQILSGQTCNMSGDTNMSIQTCMSDRKPTISSQIPILSDQTSTVPDQTPTVLDETFQFDQNINIPDQETSSEKYNKVTNIIENLLPNEDLNELFSDAHRYAIKSDVSIPKHIPIATGKTKLKSINRSNITTDEYEKLSIKNFISRQEWNELFKDAHKFGKIANDSDPNTDITDETYNNLCDASDEIENTEANNVPDNVSHKPTKDTHITIDDKMTTRTRKKITISTNLNVPIEGTENCQDHTDLYKKLMSNIRKNIQKYIPKNAQETQVINEKKPVKQKQKMDTDRRKYFQERNIKLMSIAVTPYKPNGPIECSICHEVRPNQHSFRSHAKKHFKKEFVCQVAGCGKEFTHRAQLERHGQTRHGDEKRFSCAQCGFKTSDLLAIKNHVRAEHTGEKPYECNECGAKFRMRNNIVMHMKVHFERAKRNFQCEYCPSTFRCRRDLWLHQDKTHFYIFRYYCYLCSNFYRSASATKKHLLRVHGVPREQHLRITRDKIRRPDAPVSANVKPFVTNKPK